MRHLPIRCMLIFACVALMPSLLNAQEAGGIKWRTDYNAARKESEAKKLPLFIDFVRPNCPPCARMEQYTFTDPRIAAALKEKFIPVRINGIEDTALASYLNISLFPTIVMASPEGRIEGKHIVGFQEADVLHEHLQRLLASIKPNDAAKTDYANALKWADSGDSARAITTLRGILDDEKSRSLHKDSQALLEKIAKGADDKLASARDLHSKGKSLEAIEALTDIRRQFPGLKASKDAADLIGTLLQGNAQLKLEKRTKRVRELLAQAQDFYKTKDYICCMDRCEVILANYGDLPEGESAFRLAGEIKNNPVWLQAAADVMTDRLGGTYLALADTYLKRGEVQRAKHYLERVLQAFPGSRMAESAQIRLTQLQGTTPVRKDLQSAGP
ncbi:MAG: thioredoxin family protein [Planctomycetes bacterium]|nr:thioredoxin family protein [Planctomycetota bacterium]